MISLIFSLWVSEGLLGNGGEEEKCVSPEGDRPGRNW